MAIQTSQTLRSNMLNQYETTIGVSPKLFLFTGVPPANADAAPTGSILATLALPADWMNPSTAGGNITLLGSWAGTASGTGTIGHYRLCANASTTGTLCGEQGTVSVGGGGGDLTVDNTSATSGQAISITGWTRTQSGA